MTSRFEEARTGQPGAEEQAKAEMAIVASVDQISQMFDGTELAGGVLSNGFFTGGAVGTGPGIDRYTPALKR